MTLMLTDFTDIDIGQSYRVAQKRNLQSNWIETWH